MEKRWSTVCLGAARSAKTEGRGGLPFLNSTPFKSIRGFLFSTPPRALPRSIPSLRPHRVPPSPFLPLRPYDSVLIDAALGIRVSHSLPLPPLRQNPRRLFQQTQIVTIRLAPLCLAHLPLGQKVVLFPRLGDLSLLAVDRDGENVCLGRFLLVFILTIGERVCARSEKIDALPATHLRV